MKVIEIYFSALIIMFWWEKKNVFSTKELAQKI